MKRNNNDRLKISSGPLMSDKKFEILSSDQNLREESIKFRNSSPKRNSITKKKKKKKSKNKPYLKNQVKIKDKLKIGKRKKNHKKKRKVKGEVSCSKL